MSNIKEATNDIPLIHKEYLLQKFPGKGGWTYAEIPEIVQNKNNPFGWVTVKGSIDAYELKHYKLMPMGNGHLFLPVKAAVRKLIKKEAGDYVLITLYSDESTYEIPEEIMTCFTNEPTQLKENFLKFNGSEQKAYIDWIYEAKTENTQANRIATMMARLEKGLKFQDKPHSSKTS